jgi:starch phosphorylase
LPEALETWPVDLLGRLLPRHLQIIYMINYYHLKWLPDALKIDSLEALSLIAEHGERRVRMGHLAFVGSRRINGVSALHTDLLRRTVFAELDKAYPGRILNKTNGITFRRWLHEANPSLTRLLADTLGPAFLDHPEALRGLEAYAHDRDFHAKLRATRQLNKEALASFSIPVRCLMCISSAFTNISVNCSIFLKRSRCFRRSAMRRTDAPYRASKFSPGKPLRAIGMRS